ncbi:uncharacterized protein PV07_05973 [Cladophialophora immunda]|uniref:Xylanolytic transcriptional activator regulatory domain-containing protein n=1 Tax=Cladophialophora immunda TaxID=569365 RepID=A0A0D2D3B8_9EURO|nr:uncharacterized protein PV07_05973 [Cladophialophora immunda]KIW30214.1 hypothetical protein PV07_05973 [Cladophialophora immunda]
MARRLTQLEQVLLSMNNANAPGNSVNIPYTNQQNKIKDMVDMVDVTNPVNTRSPTLIPPASASGSLVAGLQEGPGPFNDLDKMMVPVPGPGPPPRSHRLSFVDGASRAHVDCDEQFIMNTFPSPSTISSGPGHPMELNGFEHDHTKLSNTYQGTMLGSGNTHRERQKFASRSDEDLHHVSEGEEVCFRDLANWEYHGPRSYLSICSKPGIHWVSSKTGTDTFQDSAFRLTKEVTRSLKLESGLTKEKVAEPTVEAAQRYVKAYFEFAAEAPFGLMDQARFESRLQAHFAGALNDDDPAWFALRNTIYAAGARIELSRAGSYRHACEVAWTYFANALLVHTELLYFRTSLSSIQALAVMAYFTDSMGNPCLEYMLSTVALRSACSKGLHRRPASSWNMSPYEQRYRNRLFWALYCLEKGASGCSGRPSMLMDEDINCEWPVAEPGSNSVNETYCSILIRLAQMSSTVTRRLSNIDSSQQPQPAQDLASTVAELDAENRRLGELLQPYLSLDKPASLPTPDGELTVQQAVYIRLYYYNITLDIHTILSNPWSRAAFNLRDHPASRLQMEKSVQTVATTARNAILASQYIHIDACTPLLLSFYGPLYALINLFIQILERIKHPSLQTQSDLALMDIGAAHFSRVQFATEVYIPFAKDIAALARTAVRRHNSDLLTQTQTQTQPVHPATASATVNPGPYAKKSAMGMGMQATASASDTSTLIGVAEVDECRDNGDGNAITGDASNLFDMELDNWSTFLPPPGSADDEFLDFLGQ